MTLQIFTITETGKELFKRIKPGVHRIGREKDCEILIDRASISRSHGLLCSAGSLWYYKDLGSTNGSWINEGEVVPDNVSPLLAGDFLQLGDTLFQVSYDEAPYLGKFIISVFEGADLILETTIYEGETLIGGKPDSTISIPDEEIDIILSLGDTAISLENRSKKQVMLNGGLSPKITNIKHGDILEIPDLGLFIIFIDARKRANEAKRANAAIVDWQLHASQYREKRAIKAESKPELFSPVTTKLLQQPLQGNQPQVFRPRRDTTILRRDDLFDFSRMTDSEKQVVLLAIFFITATFLLFLLYFLIF